MKILPTILVNGVLLFSVATPLASANEGFHKDDANLYESNNFALGVGFGIVRFDTNVKVTDKTSGDTSFIDVEGNLDLPEISRVNTLYGAYQFNLKHSLFFGYFAVNRTSNLLNVSENFNDVIIVNANIDISDKSRFYYLSYGYNLFRDDRSDITLVVGINSIDLRYVIDASGQITVAGTTKSSDRLLDANVFAPLPMVGLNFGFSFTPKWSLATKILIVGGSCDDVSANVLQTSVNALYKFNENIGLLMGITYFNAAVTIDDETDKTDIAYGYDGGFIGMHFGF
jgi:hypothetical protein